MSLIILASAYENTIFKNLTSNDVALSDFVIFLIGIFTTTILLVDIFVTILKMFLTFALVASVLHFHFYCI